MSRTVAAASRGRGRLALALAAVVLTLCTAAGTALAATPWSTSADGNGQAVAGATGSAPARPALSSASCGASTETRTASWSGVPNATGYLAELSFRSDWTRVIASVHTASTSASLTFPTWTKTYAVYFRVRAVFGTWVSRASAGSFTNSCTNANAGSTAVASPSFSTPVSSTCGANADGSFTASLPLSWSSVSAATQYTVQAAVDPGFTRPVASQTTTGTSATLRAPTDVGGTLWVRVFAANGYSSSDPTSNGNAGITQVTVACPVTDAPLNLRQTGPNWCNTISGGYDAVVPFAWDAVAGATGYTVQVATDPNFTQITTSAPVTHTTANLTSSMGAGTATRYIRVQATNGGNYGIWGAIGVTLTCPVSSSPSTAPSTTAPSTTSPTTTTAPPAPATTDPTTTAPPTTTTPDLVAPANFRGGSNTCTSQGNGYYTIALPVSWSAVPGAAGYTVDGASDSGFSSLVATASPTTTSAKLSATGPKGTFTVYLRVRATNGTANGPYSTISTSVTC